jgi:hypothetical protein
MVITRNTTKMAGQGTIEVLGETGTSRDNVSRLARREGRQVEVQEIEDGFKQPRSKVVRPAPGRLV